MLSKSCLKFPKLQWFSFINNIQLEILNVLVFSEPVRSDDQLNFAIQMSLQDGSKHPPEYQKTNADITVDYFLKSLAGK